MAPEPTGGLNPAPKSVDPFPVHRRRVIVPVLVVLSLVALTRPAAAQSDGWVELATDSVLEEIILLTEAGAFTPDPVLATFVDEYGWGFGPSERAELLNLLDQYDADGAAMVGAEPAELSPEAAAALAPMPTTTRDALTAGQTAFLDPTPHLDGLSDVLRRRGAAPTGARDPAERTILVQFVVEYASNGFWAIDDYLDPAITGSTATTTSPPTSAAPTAATPPTTADPGTGGPTSTISSAFPVEGAAPQDPDGPPDGPGETGPLGTADGPSDAPGLGGVEASTGDGDPTSGIEPSPDGLAFGERAAIGGDELGDGADGRSSVPVPLLMVAVGLVAVAAALIARRRLGVSDDDGRLRRFAEIGRKLAAGSSVVEVVETAMAETVRFTGAEAAAYHELTPDGLRLAGASDHDRFNAGTVLSSLVNDVVNSGQANRSVVERDSALQQETAAMAATPVVDGGSIVGVISVVRAPAAPFGVEVLDSLGALAPLLGTAFAKARALEEAVQESAVDWLTQLPNRRKFDDDLARLAEVDRPISVAVVDIDHFKSFNDTYGHETGDVVIRAVADSLATTVEADGLAYRYGGEEFSVLLVGDAMAAAATMERSRVAIQQMALPDTPATRHSGGSRVTVSIGVATGPTDEIESLLRLADQAMYSAKHGGRNRVVVGVQPTEPGVTPAG
ncbi:MAG: sensor domain-containing diguanylate cyclase [Actinomycetota bacterium]